MAVLGGAGGHFISWAPVLSVRDPTEKTTVLAVTRRHRRVFGNVLAHRNRVRVAQLSYSNDVGGFHLSFSRKSRFTGFWRGLGTWRNSEPQPTKKIDPPKVEIEKSKIEFFFFRCGFKNKFSSKTERFFFVFGPWRPQ